MHSKLISHLSINLAKAFPDLLIGCFQDKDINIWETLSNINESFLSDIEAERRKEKNFSVIMLHEHGHAEYQKRARNRSNLWNVISAKDLTLNTALINHYEHEHKRLHDLNGNKVPDISDEEWDKRIQETIKELTSKTILV